MRIFFGIIIAFSGLSLNVCAGETPMKWEQLFFPFPIVAAPPQLEQQVQIFGSYFNGDSGSALQPSAELAYIASPHLGLVATVPFQAGTGGQPSGMGDANLLVQFLATGSLQNDDMLSIGLQTVFPTGVAGYTNGDTFLGPFAYGARRFFKHLIFEANLTALEPLQHGDTAKQVLANAMISYLLTSPHGSFPVYFQTEVDSALYLSGTEGLPAGATSAPAHTVFVAPEVFLGPFKSAVSDGTRLAAGVFFNAYGDPVHDRTYTVTVAFDIPNSYGY